MKQNNKKQPTWLFGWVTSAFLLLIGTVFLLSFPPEGYEKISSVKVTFFYAICGGYVGVILVLLSESVLVDSIKLKEALCLLLPTTAVQYLALIYLGFTVLAGIFSSHSATWLGTTRNEGVLTHFIYILCFYFVSKFFVPDQWLLYILSGSVTVFSVVCILQLFGLNPLSLYPDGYNYFDAYSAYSGAYLGTIGNVDFVAAFLCIVIPIFWVSLIRLQEKRRFFLLIPLILSLLVLLRMSVLAGLIGVFCGALLSLPSVLPQSKKIRICMWCSLTVVFMAGLAILYFVEFETGILREIHLLLHGHMEDTFGSGRLYIWKNVLKKLGNGIWFGYGPDTMSLSGIPPFERFDEARNLQIVATIDAAHNEYLNILFHQGIFALSSYLAMLGLCFRDFLKKANQNAAIAICGCAMVCYCIQAFFGISQPITTPFFWLLLGVFENFVKKDQ